MKWRRGWTISVARGLDRRWTSSINRLDPKSNVSEGVRGWSKKLEMTSGEQHQGARQRYFKTDFPSAGRETRPEAISFTQYITPEGTLINDITVTYLARAPRRLFAQLHLVRNPQFIWAQDNFSAWLRGAYPQSSVFLTQSNFQSRSSQTKCGMYTQKMLMQGFHIKRDIPANI